MNQEILPAQVVPFRKHGRQAGQGNEPRGAVWCVADWLDYNIHISHKSIAGERAGERSGALRASDGPGPRSRFRREKPALKKHLQKSPEDML